MQQIVQAALHAPADITGYEITEIFCPCQCYIEKAYILSQHLMTVHHEMGFPPWATWMEIKLPQFAGTVVIEQGIGLSTGNTGVRSAPLKGTEYYFKLQPLAAVNRNDLYGISIFFQMDFVLRPGFTPLQALPEPG